MFTLQSPEPYAKQIQLFVRSEFNHFGNLNTEDMLELVTAAIVATGQIRYGPKPSPESLVLIRQAITYWLDKHLPIPVLIPWGSQKPNGSGVDIAELFAMKMLKMLQDRVVRHYTPGLYFTIRIEDVSAPNLYFDRQDYARRSAKLYTDGFVNLVSALGIRHFVNPLKESDMTTEAAFNARAEQYIPAFERHILLPEDTKAVEKLVEFGWSGALEPATVNFYLAQYQKLYPADQRDKQLHRLARYFSGALARKTLKITGYHHDWQNQNLELSFASMPPGFPKDRAGRRLTYRTLPESMTNSHISPWRAKGYLCCHEDGVSGRLARFNDPLKFNPFYITLSDGKTAQDVQADYTVREDDAVNAAAQF